jgi:hypothetical protein
MTGDILDTSETSPGIESGYLVRGGGGIFASIALSDQWTIQPEILYTQKAGKWEETVSQGELTGSTTQEIEIEYVEIPVLMKFTLPQSGKIQPFFYAGPAIAFSAASSVKIKATADSAGIRIRRDDYYASKIYNAKSTIIEGVIGIGLELKTGSGIFTFEGRYTRDFGAVFDDVDDFDVIPEDDAVVAHYPSGDGVDLNHSVFSFIIGYGFSL